LAQKRKELNANDGKYPHIQKVIDEHWNDRKEFELIFLKICLILKSNINKHSILYLPYFISLSFFILLAKHKFVHHDKRKNVKRAQRAN